VSRRFARVTACQARVLELEPRATSNELHERLALRLSGPLRIGALARAVAAVIVRHEILRTVFVSVQGQTLQQVQAPPRHPLSQIDLRALPAVQREAAVERVIARRAQPRFNLTRGPLLRVWVLRIADEDALLLIAVHHAIFDGWSAGVLLRDLAALYEGCLDGQPPRLPPLTVHYQDLARREARYLESVEAARHLAYWRDAWTSAWEDLDLPRDAPRPLRRTGAAGVEEIAVSPEAFAGLRAAAADAHCTLFGVTLAALNVLLHRASGQRGIAIGVAVTNREPDAEPLIGPCVNLLVMCTAVTSDQTLAQAVRAARETVAGAYAHQALPFWRLLRELHPGLPQTPYGIDGHPPRLRVAYDHHVIRGAAATPRLSGLRVTPTPAREVRVGCDLYLHAVERADGLDMSLLYSREIFDAARGARMARQLGGILQAMAVSPGVTVSRLCLSS
jgi:hypothetical protein